MVLCYAGLWLACVDERARECDFIFNFIESFYCSHLGQGLMDGWMAFPGE